MSGPTVVIGIGNRFRRDDGAALHVIEMLRDRVPASVLLVESDGEPTRLIDSWTDVQLAVVVETVRRGEPPGTVFAVEWETWTGSSAAAHREHGSHSLGVLEAIALGDAVGRMPGRLRLIGIEPEDVGWGEGLSPAIATGVDNAARLVLDYLGATPPASGVSGRTRL
ncbi:MAG: hydrogenase maturation protease [Candidatus Dormiibacterota bacterium]